MYRSDLPGANLFCYESASADQRELCESICYFLDFEEFSEWFLQQDKGLRGDVARRTRKLEEAMSDPMLNLPDGWLEKVLG